MQHPAWFEFPSFGRYWGLSFQNRKPASASWCHSDCNWTVDHVGHLPSTGNDLDPCPCLCHLCCPLLCRHLTLTTSNTGKVQIELNKADLLTGNFFKQMLSDIIISLSKKVCRDRLIRYFQKVKFIHWAI